MMTPTSLLRIVIILVGLGMVFALAGCKMPALTGGSSTPPKALTPPSQTGTGAPAVDEGRQAEGMICDYLTALNDHDYAKAYDLLARDAQKSYTRAYFEQQGKQGMPQYDLKTAKYSAADHLVVVQELEDPSLHGFPVVREGQTWKYEYRGGRPGEPNAGAAPAGRRKGDTNESDSH